MTNWSKNPNRSRGTPHINKFLWKIAKPAMRRRGFSDRTLIEHWASVVGPQLASLSQPMRLSRKGMKQADGADATNGGGVLTVKVEGAMALEIQHLAPQIIDRLNEYYGYAAVAKLTIVQGPLYHAPRPDVPTPPKPAEVETLARTMDDISSPRLKQALARLSLRLKERLKGK